MTCQRAEAGIEGQVPLAVLPVVGGLEGHFRHFGTVSSRMPIGFHGCSGLCQLRSVLSFASDSVLARSRV